MGTADAQKDAAVHLFLSLHPAVFFEDLTDASRKNIGSALKRSISFFSFVPLHGLFLADGFWRFLRPHAGLMPSLPSLPSLPLPFAESPLNASEVSGREKCPENGESTELADFQWRSHQ